MTSEKQSETPSLAHANVGDEIDVEHTAQTITPAAIQSIVMSSEPIHVRRDQLLKMKKELEARCRRDADIDVSPLISEVNHALATVG